MQHLVEGWTNRIQTQLLADGSPLDLTNYNVPPAAVAMQLYGRNGRLVSVLGTTGIQSGEAATGVVYFDPDPADLHASLSPYTVRWKVTDSAGKVAYFPNDHPEIWVVAYVSGA